MSKYVITVPDGSLIDVDSLAHTFTHNAGTPPKILTDTVLATSRNLPASAGIPQRPGLRYYYIQTYTYDVDGNLTGVSPWTQGDPYVPPGSAKYIVWQNGKGFGTQDGKQITTQGA